LFGNAGGSSPNRTAQIPQAFHGDQEVAERIPAAPKETDLKARAGVSMPARKPIFRAGDKTEPPL
jgi:hypothetical protein